MIFGGQISYHMRTHNSHMRARARAYTNTRARERARTQTNINALTNTYTHMIYGGVQPFSTTLLGLPFPQPTPQGRWLSNLKLKLEDVIRKGHEAPTRASLDR